MIATLRSSLSGITLLLCAAVVTAQSGEPVTPPPAAPDVAPAPVTEFDGGPHFDVLQFTPDEAFIDLRANLADAWGATLGVLAEMKYPVDTGLAYVDAGGQIMLSDLWVAVEPHVSRGSSFTRVRIALVGTSDHEYLQARAEVLLDAVATRLEPAPIRPAAPAPAAEPAPAAPVADGVYDTAVAPTYVPSYSPVYVPTYIPYYVSYPVPICSSPYDLPYYSSFSCLNNGWWWNHCWSNSWGWNGCHHSWFVGFNHCGWSWGFNGSFGSLCLGWGSGWGGCGSWWGPGCSWWDGPCHSNDWCGSGGWHDDVANGPQQDFQFHTVDFDADIVHLPRHADFVTSPAPSTPTRHVTSRERRNVPAAERHPNILVTHTEPRHSSAPSRTPTSRGSGIPTIVVTSGGTSAPRAGSVVRLPSATYGSRSPQAPNGRVSTTYVPTSNSGPVSSVPLAYGGRSSSPAPRSQVPSYGSSGSSSRVPVYGSTPSLSSPPSTPPMMSSPSPAPASRSSGGHHGFGSSGPSVAPSAPSMPSASAGRSSSAPSSHASGSSGRSSSAGSMSSGSSSSSGSFGSRGSSSGSSGSSGGRGGRGGGGRP